MITLTKEAATVAAATRGIGKHLSMFAASEYWLTGPERLFEVWLYRNGFRPADEHYLGATELLDGLTADILNSYFHDKEYGFSKDSVPHKSQWTWGHVAAFASKVKQIKQLARKGDNVAAG